MTRADYGEDAPSSPRVLNQCDPSSTVVFETRDSVGWRQWDPKHEKNLWVSRPADRGPLSAVEVARMVRDAPRVKTPPRDPSVAIPDDRPFLPVSSLRPAYYPTERAARAFADAYERPTTAGATVYRVKRFGPGETGDGFASGRRSSESASRSSFSRRPSTARLSESSASLAAYVKLARDDGVELDARAKRQVHVAVSERAYTSHTARPTTAPASRNDGGFARNKTSHAARAGRSSSGLRGEWRGAHFTASAKDAVVVAEVDADVSRGGGGSGGGVGRYGIARALRDASESHKGDSTRCRSLGGLTGGAPREREPARGTFRARGGKPRPSSAFVREETTAGEVRSTTRPMSAFVRRGGGGGETTPRSTTRASASTSTSTRAVGNGLGGGGLPVDDDLLATLTVTPSKFSTKPASHLSGGAGFGAKKRASFARSVRRSGSPASSETSSAFAGDGDGRPQAMISSSAHLKRVKDIGSSLNARQMRWVARTMETTRKAIREERSYGGDSSDGAARAAMET